MMTEDEARTAIREHFQGDTGNVRRFLEALQVAEKAAGSMTLEQLEAWGKGENQNDQSD
jgi:hypothetical protein